MAAGGSAHRELVPGSAQHSAMRQYGVTAWKMGLLSLVTGPCLRSATKTRSPRSMTFPMREVGRPSAQSSIPHQRRGDVADALFREMQRRIVAAVRSGGALPPKKP